MRGKRALFRVVVVTAFVTTYLTLHLGVSAAMRYQEREQYRDLNASRHATAFTTALNRFLAGDRSAYNAMLVERAWFDDNLRHAPFVFDATRAASAGRPEAARRYAVELSEYTEFLRRVHDRRFREWSIATLVFALPSALFVTLAMWLRQRRRRGVADVVEVVRRHVPERPRWQRPAFLVLTGIGYTLLLSGLLAVEVAVRGYSVPGNIRLLAGAGGAIALAAGWLTVIRFRRRAARSAASALLADGRRPVLYLRSFAEDHTSASVDPLPGAWEGMVLNIHSREEQLAGVLSAFGPVIAVGRPGESLPYLGAARFYLPHDQWRPEIRRLMELSQLIVLRLGAGEGLWWEVEQARDTQPPHKLVLLVPGQWAGLTNRLAEQLRTRSPLKVVHGGDAWTSAVITFDHDWNPHPHPVTPPGTRKSLNTPAHEVARAMQAALAAVGVRKRMMALRAGVRMLTIFGRFLLIIPAVILLIRVEQLIFPGQ